MLRMKSELYQIKRSLFRRLIVYPSIIWSNYIIEKTCIKDFKGVLYTYTGIGRSNKFKGGRKSEQFGFTNYINGR